MRNVLVTGGSRGIGRAIVEVLESAGYHVTYTFHSGRRLDGLSSLGYKLDITDRSSCLNMLAELERQSRYPEILINNAGICKDNFFHKMNYCEWNSVLVTNLISLYHITQPVFSRMRDSGYGRIVNISSVNAHRGQLGQVNYCASKAGILGLTKALALEGARFGITVNSISPGYTDTDMTALIREDIREGIQAAVPLARFAEPKEIAKAVLFLISEDSSYITGTDFHVNGGLYI